MRMFLKGVMMGLLALGSAACAETEEKGSIALVAVGPVDDAIVQRVHSWAENNLVILVPLWDAHPETFATLDEAGTWAASQLKPEDRGVVVLDWPSENLPTHGILKKADRVFVANVRAMKTEGVDDETFGRRMERQVIRGIGLLVGLDLAQNPQSAMAPYETLEQLDQIGRNLDPPWASKFQKRVDELGIPANTNSPYYQLQ